nr:PQQ-binding-like beta-propeller repeat protein [Haloarchaeobius amylolyticus]
MKSTALLGAGGLAFDGISRVGRADDSDTHAAPAGWPQFGRDPMNTTVGAAGPAGSFLDRAWRVDAETADGSSPDGFASQPVVVDGTAYAVTANGWLGAWDLADGEPVWTTDRYSRSYASPAVVDGTLYLVTTSRTVAVDAGTGEQQWAVDRGGFAAPTVVGDTLFVAAAPGGFDAGSDYISPSELAALSTADGRERWTVETDGQLDTTPAVADGLVVVAGEGTVHAVDAETGEAQWTTEHGSERASSVSLVNGDVYGQTDAGVFALDVETGEETWTRDLGGLPNWRVGSGASPPPWQSDGLFTAAATRDTVFATVRVQDDPDVAHLFALDAETGETRWSFDGSRWDDVAGAEASVQNAPAVAEDTVYVVGESDSVRTGDDPANAHQPITLYALDAETGEVTREFHAVGGTAPDTGNADVEAPVTVVDGYALLSSHVGNGTSGRFLSAFDGVDEPPEIGPEGVSISYTDDPDSCTATDFAASLDQRDLGVDPDVYLRWSVDGEYLATTRATVMDSGPSIQFDAGSHTVSVTAYDQWGRTVSDSVAVTVSADCGDEEETDVGIEVRTTDPTAGENVRVTATVDGEADGLDYDWSAECTDDICGDGRTVGVRWDDAGEYGVSVTVTDEAADEEYTASTTVDVDE